MEKAYRRNIFSQQLSFKWKQLAHIKDEVNRATGSDAPVVKLLVVVALVAVYLTDSVLGVVCIHFIRKSGVEILLAQWVSVYTTTVLECTEWLLNWLMDVPAGLKLNAQMTEFLAVKCLSVLSLWKYFYLSFIHFYLNYIIVVIFSLRFAGLTVVLSITHDFMKFLNLCLICFYIFSVFLLQNQVSALKSLFRLFMGKKRNPLRNRIDSCDYDTSHLLLGTLFFTILLFLLPTTAMFYLVFFTLRVGQFCIQLTIRVTAVLVNQLLVSIASRLVTLHVTPSISSARITISPLHHGSAIATVKWNSCKHTAHDFEQILKTYSKGELIAGSEGTKCNTMPYSKHLMLKWLDTTPF